MVFEGQGGSTVQIFVDRLRRLFILDNPIFAGFDAARYSMQFYILHSAKVAPIIN